MNKNKVRALKKNLPKGTSKREFRAAKRNYNAIPRAIRHKILPNLSYED